MANKIAETSPQVYARIGGLAYLIIIVAGAMGEIFIRSKLIVADDAAATAKNISASPLLWRIGIFGDLVCMSSILSWRLFTIPFSNG